MLQKKMLFSMAIMLGLGLSGLQAQEAIMATGGNASGNGGAVSYSVGQSVYSTNNGTSGSVAQGVQQPYEIFTVGIEETSINISLAVYPNPTADILTLQIKDFNSVRFTYQLFDMNGKLLENKKITGNETSIGMSNLVPANYLLKVTKGNKEVKTFKIIKK